MSHKAQQLPMPIVSQKLTIAPDASVQAILTRSSTVYPLALQEVEQDDAEYVR